MVLVVKNHQPTQETRDTSSVSGQGRSPGEGKQPTPVFLSGKSHGQRSLAGCSPQGHKDSDTHTFQIEVRSQMLRVQASTIK